MNFFIQFIYKIPIFIYLILNTFLLFRKGSKKTLILAKKNEYELFKNEPNLVISNEAKHVIEQSKDMLEISPVEREELMSRIQKSNCNVYL